MKDEQIIKALESLLDRLRAYEAEQASIGKGLITETLDLINRKDAEIGRLQGECKRKKGASLIFNGGIKYVKSEAYKEFAERLKEIAIEKGSVPIVFDDIDNLVKELTDHKNHSVSLIDGHIEE